MVSVPTGCLVSYTTKTTIPLRYKHWNIDRKIYNSDNTFHLPLFSFSFDVYIFIYIFRRLYLDLQSLYAVKQDSNLSQSWSCTWHTQAYFSFPVENTKSTKGNFVSRYFIVYNLFMVFMQVNILMKSFPVNFLEF